MLRRLKIIQGKESKMIPRLLTWENVSIHYHPVWKCVCCQDKGRTETGRLTCPRDSGNDIVWNISFGHVELEALSVNVEVLRADELTNGVMINNV